MNENPPPKATEIIVVPSIDEFTSQIPNSINLQHHNHNETANDTSSETKECSQEYREVTEVECEKKQAPRTVQYRLHNAKQNQDFYVELSSLDDFPSLVTVHIVDDANTGLAVSECESENNILILSGLPRISGDCTLNLHGRDASSHEYLIELILLVNPDPKTLWNTIEPTSSLFRKPHQAFDVLSTEYATLTAARVRGRSHAHKGSFCEDDIAITYDDTVGYLGMVSDGAGSSRYSRLASHVLTESIPRNFHIECSKLVDSGCFTKLKTILEAGDTEQQEMYLPMMEKLLGCAVQRGFFSLAEHCKLGDGIQLSDLYATCLVFWALPLSNGRWAIASYWVGDGGLAIIHNDTVALLGKPDSGEFSGQTRFLTEQEACFEAITSRTQARIYQEVQSIWAMTDGITDAYFSSESALEDSRVWLPLVDDISRNIDNADTAYEWLQFWSQGEHDDRAFASLIIQHKEKRACDE